MTEMPISHPHIHRDGKRGGSGKKSKMPMKGSLSCHQIFRRCSSAVSPTLVADCLKIRPRSVTTLMDRATRRNFIWALPKRTKLEATAATRSDRPRLERENPRNRVPQQNYWTAQLLHLKILHLMMYCWVEGNDWISTAATSSFEKLSLRNECSTMIRLNPSRQ